eukprot:CAMPEP_0174743012 /NCGR_PEP_ID=MMETSP1094-20130205/80524_1 /TAXON_ID=156173 /ORGANISM="Chrysochromulina brevifilum, Strain UTEX LB 985" /LENGTH=86 /DNA_ID=CAMNT_0015947159 /DNA_START=568 /DNA_END=826 /DNA_ORIENTATION=+
MASALVAAMTARAAHVAARVAAWLARVEAVLAPWRCAPPQRATQLEAHGDGLDAHQRRSTTHTHAHDVRGGGQKSLGLLQAPVGHG